MFQQPPRKITPTQISTTLTPLNSKDKSRVLMMGQPRRNASLLLLRLWVPLNIILILPLVWSAAKWGSSGWLGLGVSSAAIMCLPVRIMFGLLGKAKQEKAFASCLVVDRRDLRSRSRKFISLSNWEQPKAVQMS